MMAGHRRHGRQLPRDGRLLARTRRCGRTCWSGRRCSPRRSSRPTWTARPWPAIRSDPDVGRSTELVHPSRQVPSRSHGRSALAATRLAGDGRSRAACLFKLPTDACRSRPPVDRPGRATVLVSESFSLRFGKAAGRSARCSLRPPATQDFSIVGGLLRLRQQPGHGADGRQRPIGGILRPEDPAAAPSSLAIFLRPGADPEAVRAGCRRRSAIARICTSPPTKTSAARRCGCSTARSRSPTPWS